MTTIDLMELTREVVADGELDDADVESIVSAARERSKERPLTTDERNEIMRIVQARMEGLSFDKIPLPLRVLSIILIVTGVSNVYALVTTAMSLAGTGILANAIKNYTATTVIVAVLAIIFTALTTVLSIFIGVRMLKGKRGKASVLLKVSIAFTVLSMICVFMLFGISHVLIPDLLYFFAQNALAHYLDPSLRAEAELQLELRKLDTEVHAKSGTLGLADPGKGYIRLDLFNLFWTFMIGSFLGLIVEIIWHMVVVDPGVYQDRAGLLWGPFSPIYGFGAVLMTMALNRFKDRNIVFIFVVCTIIGGAFEYSVSWFMEIAFGATAWDYSDQFLGNLFGGRTCLLFASMFGVLGLVWIKLLLPLFLSIFNKIPYKLRDSVTLVCLILMLINGAMTLQALDNWSARVAGHVPQAEVELFYAEHFDDEYMANRFQSMTINPEASVRV